MYKYKYKYHLEHLKTFYFVVLAGYLMFRLWITIPLPAHQVLNVHKHLSAQHQAKKEDLC